MRKQRYVISSRDQAARVGALVGALSVAGRPWQVTIEPFVKRRTLPQNALYWQWLTIIGDAIGYDKDEMHDVFREKFLPVEYREVLGVMRKVLTSTSSEDFTTAHMSEYMNHIERFAAQELGILLPHPEDEWLESVRQ